MSGRPAVQMENERVHQDEQGRVFLLRRCVSLQELDQCVELQQQSWGYPDREVVPRNLFVLAQALGGHVFGAWAPDGQLAGFCMAVAAHEPSVSAASEAQGWMRPVGSNGSAPFHGSEAPGVAPIPYLHSHMLAVAPAYQNRGLGFALKLVQREDARSRGIQVIRWTFDPLMAKNAYFNLHRLGATARMYIRDFYGRLGSALQGGLPTDRLLAEWRLDTDRVRSGALVQRPEQTGRIVETIPLPAEVAAAKARGDRSEAETMQREIRGRLEDAFARNLHLEGFQPDARGGGEYLLAAAANMANMET